MKYFFQALWIGAKELAWAALVVVAFLGLGSLVQLYPLYAFLAICTAIVIVWLVLKTLDLKRKDEVRKAREHHLFKE